MIDEPMTWQHELERRVSTLADEVEGEKRVSRHILQETRQNSGDLSAIKAQLMHLAGDMVVANAALNSHGVRLNVLTQDVREIRNAMGELRAEVAQTHTEMSDMRAEVAQTRTEMGELRAELRAEVAQIRTEMGDMRAEVARTRTEMGELRAELRAEVAQTRTEMGELRVEIDRRFDVVERSIAVILAAVAPSAR